MINKVFVTILILPQHIFAEWKVKVFIGTETKTLFWVWDFFLRPEFLRQLSRLFWDQYWVQVRDFLKPRPLFKKWHWDSFLTPWFFCLSKELEKSWYQEITGPRRHNMHIFASTWGSNSENMPGPVVVVVPSPDPARPTLTDFIAYFFSWTWYQALLSSPLVRAVTLNHHYQVQE